MLLACVSSLSGKLKTLCKHYYRFRRRKDESFLAAIVSFQVQLRNCIIWDYHYFSFVKLVRVYSNASDRI